MPKEAHDGRQGAVGEAGHDLRLSLHLVVSAAMELAGQNKLHGISRELDGSQRGKGFESWLALPLES